MKRDNAIAHMRIAGYHSDRKTFTRLLIESRVSWATANAAWGVGLQQRAAGVKCHCLDCKKIATNTTTERSTTAITP